MANLVGELNNPNSFRIEGVGLSSSQSNLGLSYPTNATACLKVLTAIAVGINSNCLITANCFQAYSSQIYYDYLSSFARFFGVNSYQDSQRLYISLQDLSIQNTINPTAESLLVALLERVQKCESNVLISNVYIQLFGVIFERQGNPKMTFVLLVSLFKKIDYSVDNSQILNAIMLNYSDSIIPNDF